MACIVLSVTASTNWFSSELTQGYVQGGSTNIDRIEKTPIPH